MQYMVKTHPELNWGAFAILYRTNAQSRPFEDLLIQSNIPYNIVGGLKFYDRKEIKDALAYLRLLVNPDDTVSLLRIINTPRRGIGKATINSLTDAAQELGVPLWDIISDETSATTMSGRAAKSVNQFVQMIKTAQEKLETATASELLNFVIEESGYVEQLKQKGTDEDDNRIANVYELNNAIVQFQEDNEETSLEAFLSSAALASDLDSLDESEEKVSLMTLHAAKGLEFPLVFLVGVEQGLLPHNRTLNDPIEIEEERRLCYVGITRAQEQLFITYTRERRLWGYREPAIASQFLKEIPEDLIASNISPENNYQRSKTAVVKQSLEQKIHWSVGDRILHKDFGEGEITHVLNGGTKPTLAVKFHELQRTKILSQSAPIELLEKS